MEWEVEVEERQEEAQEQQGRPELQSVVHCKHCGFRTTVSYSSKCGVSTNHVTRGQIVAINMQDMRLTYSPS